MSQIEKLVEEFISDLQWDLRASYNSSSCLNKKQREFLKEKLEILLSDFSNTLDLLKQQPSQQECDAAMVEGFEHTISKEDEEWMNAPMGTPKQQPTAWEFTKEIREKLTINPCETTECKLNSTDKECIECLEDAVFDMGNDLRKACDIIDSAESINADLLTICEQVQDWLDTSSLQKVLVHCTDAKEKDALIMGVASHLERLEAAIEKAKV